MSSLIRDPVRMTPGVKQDLYVGLDLASGDTISSIDDVTITTSSADVTVANAALNVGTVVIRGVSYPAGTAVGYDLEYDGSIVGGALAAYADFAWDSAGGAGQTERVNIEVVAALEANYSDSPATVMGTDFEIVIGISEGDTDLGTFTGATIPNDSSVKTALQALETAHETLSTTVSGHTTSISSIENIAEIGFNVLDYGADPTGAADSTAAILAAHNASYAAVTYIANTTSNSSTNRRYQGPVIFPPGKYRIDSPIVLDDEGQHINWIGYGAVLCAAGTGGTSGSFSGDAGVRIGLPTGINQQAMFVDMQGLKFVGFPVAIRDGIAPNNTDQSLRSYVDCHFIGPTGGAGTGVRFFTRSTLARFDRCNFNGLVHAIDMQSIDKVVVNECWCQLKSVPAYTARPTYDGQFRVNQGALFVRNSIFIPGGTPIGTNGAANPYAWFIAQDYADFDTGATYIVGDIARNSGTLYVATTANGPGAFDAGDWQVVDESSSGPLSAWTTIDIEGCLLGGETQNVAAVIWDHEPDASTPSHLAYVCRLKNNQLAGLYSTPIGASGYNPQVLLVNFPNRLEVVDNCYSQINAVAADYHTGTTAPTPITNFNYRTFETVIGGNQGGGADPNWIPENILPLAAGTGITTGSGTVYKSWTERRQNLIETKVLLDLTGLRSTAAGDIIGVDGTSLDCHIGRILAIHSGTILTGKITCLEAPSGGDADIDLYSATEATGSEDDAITGLAETLLCDGGAQTIGKVSVLTAMPATGQYLYLVVGAGGSTDGTYTAGKLLIELTGYE